MALAPVVFGALVGGTFAGAPPAEGRAGALAGVPEAALAPLERVAGGAALGTLGVLVCKEGKWEYLRWRVEVAGEMVVRAWRQRRWASLSGAWGSTSEEWTWNQVLRLVKQRDNCGLL